MRKGFTIIEILIVFVILVILMGVGLGGHFYFLERAREISAKGGLRVLHIAVEMYATNHEGRYPTATNLHELLMTLRDYLVDRELPKNPYNNEPYKDDNNDHYKLTYTYDPRENAYTLTVMNRDNTKVLLLLSNRVVLGEDSSP